VRGNFVEKTKEKLGIKILGRKITESNGVYELKESNTTCARNFMHVMVRTGAKRYYWANGIRIFRAQSTDQGIARYLEG